jgi:hypothetical protein
LNVGAEAPTPYRIQDAGVEAPSWVFGEWFRTVLGE